jgi:hypothetical protein
MIAERTASPRYATAAARPEGETLTTVVSEEVQATARPESTVPDAPTAETVSCSTAPACNVTEAAVT